MLDSVPTASVRPSGLNASAPTFRRPRTRPVASAINVGAGRLRAWILHAANVLEPSAGAGRPPDCAIPTTEGG